MAGDVFDDGWRPSRCPPELVNFALTHLPERVYAVPGQHDLVHHRLADLRKSAFWTLAEAGRLTYLRPGEPLVVDQLLLWGFPWGYPVRPCPKPHSLCLNVAVVHAYAWTKRTGFPGAREEKRAKAYFPKLQGYDLAVFGDNHIPFRAGSLFNCGALYGKRTDERAYRPSVGLLYADGTVARHYLDVSKDQWAPPAVCDWLEKHPDFARFVGAVNELGEVVADYAAELLRAADADGAPEEVRQLLVNSLGGGK
jgi:hypothetical protein